MVETSLAALGFPGLGPIHRNASVPRLVEAAVARGEVQLARGGAVLASTGEHTGRSPND
ncbi:MAG: phosphoenolpyruvate carboxykinase (ATP), partial [Thermoanaerobaculia bacterium]